MPRGDRRDAFWTGMGADDNGFGGRLHVQMRRHNKTGEGMMFPPSGLSDQFDENDANDD